MWNSLHASCAIHCLIAAAIAAAAATVAVSLPLKVYSAANPWLCQRDRRCRSRTIPVAHSLQFQQNPASRRMERILSGITLLCLLESNIKSINQSQCISN